MSSALPLIVLGHVYVVTNSSLVNVYNGSIPLPSFGHLSNQIGIEPVSPDSPDIRQGYTHTPGIGAHKVHGIAAKWSDADSICVKEGGHLAVINSVAESKVLAKLFKNSVPHIGTADQSYAYIGFHDLFKEGQYVTLDDTPLQDTGYFVWKVGEPSNGASSSGEDCGSIYYDGKLNDFSCEEALGFICELTPTHGTT